MTNMLKAEAPQLTSVFTAIQPNWGIKDMNAWMLEMFGAEGLETVNNPDLGCFIMIVDSVCNEMVNKEDKSRFFKTIPEDLQNDYNTFITYMRAFARRGHSGLGSQQLYASGYGEGSQAYANYGAALAAVKN